MAADNKKIIKKQLELLANRIMTEGEQIETEDLIIAYDNGGGQSGVRENPFYPAYERLLASYVKTLTAAKELCGEDDDKVRSLDSIRQKFKVAK